MQGRSLSQQDTRKGYGHLRRTSNTGSRIRWNRFCFPSSAKRRPVEDERTLGDLAAAQIPTSGAADDVELQSASRALFAAFAGAFSTFAVGMALKSALPSASCMRKSWLAKGLASLNNLLART